MHNVVPKFAKITDIIKDISFQRDYDARDGLAEATLKKVRKQKLRFLV